MPAESFRPFAVATTPKEMEETTRFLPRFDAAGLLPAIVTDTSSGNVLMFAWMNAHALDLTLQTGIVHFWSRSRNQIWQKGEETGNTLHVREIRTDCDQDVLWIKADIAGTGVACHTKRKSCFYRTVQADADAATVRLEFVDD